MRPTRTYSIAVAIISIAAMAAAFTPARRWIAARDAATANPVASDPDVARARELLDKGNFVAAQPWLEAALAAGERRHDERAIADSLYDLARAQWGRGDYATALTTQRRALDLRRKLDDLGGQAQSLNNIGLTLYSMGRYDEALEQYNEALAVDRKQPSRKLEGVVLANIGLVHRYEGRYDEATRYFQESLRVRRQVGDPAAIGQTLNHLGMTTRAQGAYARALQYYGESLALRRQGGDRQGEAQTLNNMGNVYLDLGDTERAIEAYRESEAIAEAIGYRAQIGFSNENLGAALSQLNRPLEARERYEAAIREWRELGRKSQIAETVESLAELYVFDLGDPRTARPLAEESLAVAREIKEAEAEATALATLGTIERQTAHPRAAVARFDAAEAITARLGNPGVEYRVRAGRALALADLGRTSEALAELRTSAGIVNGLRANLTSDAGKIGLMDTHREVFEELAALLTRVHRPREALEAAESARARAFADLLGGRPLLKSLRSEDLELSSLIDVASPSVDEIRGVGHRLRATLVEYFVTENRLLMWVVGPHGTIHSAAIDVSRDRLTGLVKQVRDGIGADRFTGDDPATRVLRALGEVLVDPVDAWLPASPDEPVVIVPDGPLALLPFAALIDARGHALVERHTLAFAPAISLFRYTNAGAGRPRGGALIVADPRPPRGSGAAPLPGARDEARRVADRLVASNVRLLIGADATEAAVKREAGAAAVLHLATHGVISSDRPLASSLLLGEGDGEDGYLRADEIFRLRLHADLVVLSGCSTGVGRLSDDGILGLTRAFIYAGAGSLMVSQWDVSDRATAMLVDRFYSELQAGHGKAQALRLAELAARARYPHAALWAPFVLIGEPS